MAGPRGRSAALLWLAALVGCADAAVPPPPLAPGPWPAEAPSPALLSALARPVDLSVRGEPLVDVLPRLAEAAGAELTVAPSAVAALADRGEPWVFAEFRRQPLDEALRTLLAPFDFKLVAEGERLAVRPRIDASGPKTTRIYPIIDLVGREGGTFTEAACLEVATRGLAGGHFEAVPGALVVAHTDDAHAEVQRLLAEIRAVADPAAWEAEGAAASQTSSSPDLSRSWVRLAGESRLAAQLRERVRVAWERLSVHQLAEWLADEHGMTVFVELDALAMELHNTGAPLGDSIVEQFEAVVRLFGPEGNAPVAWDGPLDVALRRTLRTAALEWGRIGETLVIANRPDEYNVDPVTLRVYPTADLVDGRVWTSSEDVVEFISSTVRPSSWDEVGGPYIVRPVPGGIFVQQTEEEHAEVASLLARLRALGDPSVVDFVDGVSVASQSIEQALNEQAEINWVERPLRDGLPELLAKHGITNVVFDNQAIDEAGCSLGDAPTFRICDVTLRQALYWALRRHGLTWTESGGAFWITSQDATYWSYSTRMYRLPGTLHALTPSSPAVLDALTSIVDPQSWDRVGGPGSMRLVPGGLVVSQSDECHLALAQTLLAVARLGRPHLPDEPLRQSQEDAQVYDLLVKNVSCDFEQEELSIAVSRLAPDLARSGRIIFDSEIERDAGVALHSRVSLTVRGVPLESALDTLLDSLDLEWIVKYGVVFICADDFERSEQWCYHLPEASPAGVDCSPRDVAELLQACAAPRTWSGVGGWGELWLFPGGMIVDQAPQVQRDVRRLLAQIRPLLVDRDAPLVESPPSEAERRLEAALALPVGPPPADAPPGQRLDQILPLLAARHGIDLVVADANVAWRLEEPPSALSPEEPLSALLDRELPPRDLGWTIARDALLVDFASAVATERRVYDARPLLRPRGRLTEAELLARVEQVLAEDDNGVSSGTFAPPVAFGGLLIGNYPHRVHRQIQDLLAAEGRRP